MWLCTYKEVNKNNSRLASIVDEGVCVMSLHAHGNGCGGNNVCYLDCCEAVRESLQHRYSSCCSARLPVKNPEKQRGREALSFNSEIEGGFMEIQSDRQRH